MKYMLLIYSEESSRPALREEQQAAMKPWIDYTNDMVTAGAHLSGEPLQPVATATTVRVRDGKRTTTDGPFAETKEVLGGYYLIDVDSLDEALDWAGKCPAVGYGSIEVRPLMEWPNPAVPTSS